MAAALALAALCALGAAGDLRVDAGLAATVRSRREAYEGVPAVTIGELEAAPAVAVSRAGALRLRAEYDPLLLLLVDVSGGAPEPTRAAALRDHAHVIQRGRLLAEGPTEGPWTARLDASASYGRDDLRSAAWAGLAVPTTARISYVDARASATLRARASDVSDLTLAGGAFRSGGTDTAAQRVLPLQDGAFGEGALGRRLSRRDELALRVAATGSTFSTGAVTAIARLAGTWEHDLSRTSALRVGAGVAGSRSDGPSTTLVRRAAPWGEAALRRAPGGARVALDGALRLEPVIDPLTGRIDERLVAAVALRWEPLREWAFQAAGHAAALRPLDAWMLREDGPTTRVAYVEGRAARRLGAHATVAALAWGRVQRSPEPGVPSFVEWGAAVELAAATARPEPSAAVAEPRARAPRR